MAVSSKGAAEPPDSTVDMCTLPIMREGRGAMRRERASACPCGCASQRGTEECDEWQRETVLNDRYYTDPLCTSSSTESTRDIQSTDGVNAIAGHAGGLCGM